MSDRFSEMEAREEQARHQRPTRIAKFSLITLGVGIASSFVVVGFGGIGPCGPSNPAGLVALILAFLCTSAGLIGTAVLGLLALASFLKRKIPRIPSA